MPRDSTSGEFNPTYDWTNPAIPEDSGRSSFFYTRFDSMFLDLGAAGGHSAPLAEFDLDSATTFFPISQVADGHYRWVPRVTIGRSEADQSGWELTYFGRNAWRRSATETGPDENQFSSTSASLQTVEANAIVSASQITGTTLLAGVRYLYFGESLNLLDTENSFSANSSVANYLFGGQVGVRHSHEWNRWSVSGTGKIGVFENFASSREASLIYGELPNAHTSRASIVTDLGATIAYRASDHWSIRVGYQFLMLDGIARASTQLTDSGPSSGVIAKDNAILHGPTIGAEFRF